MQAIIMAGGMGSRLRPLTNTTPKPLVNIIDKPVMEYVIENLALGGVVDIGVTVGYKSQMIMDYFGDGSKWNVSLTYFEEKEPLGTAGGVKNASSFIYDDFLVLSADGFSNIDIKDFCDYHKSHRQMITMAVRYMPDARGYGLVRTDKDNLVTSFAEKPKFLCSGLINMGIYAFDKKILEEIPEGKCDFSYDIFPRHIGDIRSYSTDCFWSDIGTLSDYYLTNHYVSMHPENFGVTF